MTEPGSAIGFFLLVAALAAPIWLASERLGVLGELRIPVSDLALAFTPMLAALILSIRSRGGAGALALLRRAADFRSVPRVWVTAATLLPPCIYLVSSGVMRLSGAGAEPPALDAFRLALLFPLFLALAAGEEIGWMGYAYGRLRMRWGSLGASLALAAPWWVGHLPSMAAIGMPAGDMAWWMLGAIVLRILMSWLYSQSFSSTPCSISAASPSFLAARRATSASIWRSAIWSPAR